MTYTWEKLYSEDDRNADDVNFLNKDLIIMRKKNVGNVARTHFDLMIILSSNLFGENEVVCKVKHLKEKCIDAKIYRCYLEAFCQILLHDTHAIDWFARALNHLWALK